MKHNNTWIKVAQKLETWKAKERARNVNGAKMDDDEVADILKIS